MADELSPESKKVLEACFAQYDKSGNGILEKSELPEALQFAGICGSDQQVDAIVKYFDQSGDGKIQIKELVNNWTVLAQHSVNGEELMQSFKKFDVNGDGYIKLPELKKVLMKTGARYTEHEASTLLEDLMKFDKNKDGKFDYSEFVQMFEQEVYPFKKPQVGKENITQQYHMESKK